MAPKGTRMHEAILPKLALLEGFVQNVLNLTIPECVQVPSGDSVVDKDWIEQINDQSV